MNRTEVYEIQKSPKLEYKNDESWAYCVRPPRQPQGWKIYVSNTILTMLETLELIGPFLEGLDVSFKHVKDRSILERLNSGILGYSQIGKSIVIYAEDCGREIMRGLIEMLAAYKDRAPIIPFAVPIGGGFPIFYRYGSYRDLVINIGDDTVEDRRSSREMALPFGVPNIFMDLSLPCETDQFVDDFLSRYPVIHTLSQNGKSGVFLALNATAEDLSPVVLKMGYLHGALQGNSFDGCAYTRRELINYDIVSRGVLHCHCPRVIDRLDTSSTVVLVTEYIEGYDLFTSLRAGGLESSQIEKAWQIMIDFHKNNLVMNDPKLSNFVLEVNTDRIFAIDLEMVCGVSESNAGLKKTFRIENEIGASKLDEDKIHFLSSIFLWNSDEIKNEKYHAVKIKQLREAIVTYRDPEISKWAKIKLEEVLDSIKNRLLKGREPVELENALLRASVKENC